MSEQIPGGRGDEHDCTVPTPSACEFDPTRVDAAAATRGERALRPLPEPGAEILLDGAHWLDCPIVATRSVGVTARFDF